MSSIRNRLASRFAILVLAAVGLFAGVVYAARRVGAVTQLEQTARQRAQLASQLVRQAGASQFTVGEGISRTGFLRGSLDAIPGYLVVLNPDGSRAYASQSVTTLSAYLQGAEVSELARADYESFEASLAEARQGLRVVRFTIRNDNGVLVAVEDLSRRVVVAGASIREVNTSWREILGSALVALPFLVLLAVGGSYVLAGRVLEPIDRIREDVEAISDGRSLHRRVAIAGDDELARLTGTLNEMIGRLETSFSGLRRFTADASHELKTPLAVLRADIERAMSSPSNSTEQLVALEEGLQETARMGALVDSLLTLARADEGRFDLFREEIRLDDLVREVFETALILGEPADLDVTMPSCVEVTVLGDRTRLRQLFLNLTENAIKYTPKGGRVTLSLTRDGENANFSVQDTGVGIAAADLPYIFERFYRADRARTRGAERSGNGLGLAICQWIAQAHGGTLTVQSRLHRGSTFTATVPLAPVATEAPEPRSDSTVTAG